MVGGRAAAQYVSAVPVDARRGRHRSLGARVTGGYDHPMWGLETKLRSSAKAASTLDL